MSLKTLVLYLESVQVSCFLTWNVFNYVGTSLSGILQWPGGTSMKTQVAILATVVVRVGLVPYLMFCNLAPSDRSLPVSMRT